MKIQDIEKGMLVVAKGLVTESPFGIQFPRGTTGIVVEVKPSLGVVVEFELLEKSYSRPIICSPSELDPIEEQTVEES